MARRYRVVAEHHWASWGHGGGPKRCKIRFGRHFRLLALGRKVTRLLKQLSTTEAFSWRIGAAACQHEFSLGERPAPLRSDSVGAADAAVADQVVWRIGAA